MSLQLIVLPILCCFFRRCFCRRLIEWNQIIRQAVDTVSSCDFMQQFENSKIVRDGFPGREKVSTKNAFRYCHCAMVIVM